VLTRNLGRPSRRAVQRGISLVELMVGIAVGLLVVASAAMLTSTQLTDNRRLLLETQVHQDLRAAADIVTRELRRASHWQWADRGIWTPDAVPQPNPYASVSPTTAGATQVGYRYRRNSGEDGPFGFKLEGAALKTRMGEAGWQELTDPKTLRVTAFAVTPNHQTLVLACATPCGGVAEPACPTLTVREFIVDITGQAVSDPAVQRSLRTVVRVRNDDAQGQCPA